MSAPKHTPGPWVARKTGGAGWPEQRGFAIDFNEAQEQVVDFVYEEADAYLIAAAPDLLAALRRVLPQYEALLQDCGLASRDTTEQARAAIAKATGGAA